MKREERKEKKGVFINFFCKIKLHKFKRVAGECLLKCSRCEAQRYLDHKFKPVKGKCIKECVNCGKKIRIPHKFSDDLCEICGGQKCSRCNGTGEMEWEVQEKIRVSHRSLEATGVYAGEMVECEIYEDETITRIHSDTCSKCNGTGTLSPN